MEAFVIVGEAWNRSSFLSNVYSPLLSNHDLRGVIIKYGAKKVAVK